MKHSELVTCAGKWLKSFGCSVVLCEMTAHTNNGEMPDAIGWKGGHSILIECKSSRADFVADAKKLFRIYPVSGMGEVRLYLCPEGVISPDELPDGWGLLYVVGKRVERIVAPTGNYFPHDGPCKHFYDRSHVSEIALLVSALRRKENKD